jgi:Histidine kinase-, DNA gyrase B-, and HSP90-like ATPase.
LLDRARIDSIFQYGISTKADQGEGLGLNWVRTIVHDFHAGRVTAENLPEGGARITLLIRSMEASEARITN